MSEITLTAAIESLDEANDRILDAVAAMPIAVPNGKPSTRPDPAAWLKEAETDIAKARSALKRDEAAIVSTEADAKAKIEKIKTDSSTRVAELAASCSEHRLDIKVHEARADGARRGIAALQPRQGRKVGK